MKSVYLLRHGKAALGGGGQDHERPLIERGWRDANAMGQRMAGDDLMPERVLVSSARRAQETFEHWRQGAGWTGEAETDSGLYLASRATLCERLAGLDDDLESVLLIGHNPGLELVIRHLSESMTVMGPASLAHLVGRYARWEDLVGRGACALDRAWSPEAP